MISIYTNLDTLPKDKKFIFDADAAILSVEIIGNEFQRRILNKIEHGEYYDSSRFIDRFGISLYYDSMSTGSKALFLIDFYKDSAIINCTECGENALRMLSYINEGNIFIDNRLNPLPWDIDYPVVFNDREWSHVSLLNDYLR